MTVGEMCERWPAVKVLLARHGLDLCCGGVHPLMMAATAHGVDPQKLLSELITAAQNS
jgi:iron-sulfur cluster repair protein YtfE (RIC family)